MATYLGVTREVPAAQALLHRAARSAARGVTGAEALLRCHPVLLTSRREPSRAKETGHATGQPALTNANQVLRALQRPRYADKLIVSYFA